MEILTPDLIIIDDVMPDMRGDKLIKHMQDIPRLKDTPVIFHHVMPLTEYPYLKEVNVQEIIMRPLIPMNLVDAIKRILES